jgi:hypothetical protein
MYGIFTYIWVIFRVNVCKYSLHGAYGIWDISPKWLSRNRENYDNPNGFGDIVPSEHIALTVFFSSYEQHLTPVIVGSIYNPITTIGIARLTILVINL